MYGGIDSTTPFGQELVRSHQMSVRIEVYNFLGDLLYNSNDTIIPSGVLDGEVDVQNDSIRRRFSLQFIDSTGTLVPSDARDIFTTYGNEIKIYRGLYTRDWGRMDIPLGVFGFANVAVDDTGAGLTISLDGYDRADKISRAKLVNDYVIPAGTNFGLAIYQLILSQVPSIQTNFVTTPYSTPALTFKAGEDIWDASRKMAMSIGCELFFDPNGYLIMQTVPDYSAVDSCWTYAEGDTSTLLNINKRQTNRNTFNYFIVTGEHSSNTAPVRGVAFDDNPASPTYYKGSYGLVPAPPITSKMVTSTDQANQVARALLQNSIGQYERLHFNAIVNPAHEVGDVIQAVRALSKVNARYVLDSLAIPLTHNRAMDVTTRARQAAA